MEKIEIHSHKDRKLLSDLISPIATVVSTIIAISALFFIEKPKTALMVSLFIIIAICLAYYSIKVFFIFLRKTFSSEIFYLNWKDMPQKYVISELFKKAIVEKSTIDVIARSANNWFLGDIVKNNEDYSLIEKEKEMQSLMSKHIKSGGDISFYIQHPTLDAYFFDDQGNSQMRRDINYTIKSYKELLKLLSFEEKKRCKLYFCKESVLSSMVRIKNKSKILNVFVDLSIASRFPNRNGSEEITSRKTFAYMLHFKSKSEYLPEIDKKIIQITSHSVPLICYELDCIKEKYSDLWQTIDYKEALKYSSYFYLSNTGIDSFEYLVKNGSLGVLNCADSQCENVIFSSVTKKIILTNKVDSQKCNKCLIHEFTNEIIDCFKLLGEDSFALEIMKTSEKRMANEDKENH